LIDLRSDTVTKPTPGMRHAMANADVGDDERDGDPTTRRLEGRVAELLGKEAALFFPSGVMANQAAVWMFAARGTEVMLDVDSHIVEGEIAGVAALSGAQVFPVHGAKGVMTADDLRRDLRPPSRYSPMPSMVCVENTHNTAGGKIIPTSELKAIRAVAAERHLPVHMDGARLWNASVASGTSLAEFASTVDTVMVAFSKGLGAPVGAALAGRRGVMEGAWTARKLFGGAMRQSGVLAAAALYAIDNHMERLAEDHANAKALAHALEDVRGARVVAPDTNIVMVDLAAGDTAARVAAAAAQEGIRVAQWSPTRVRMVTHLDVTADDCARAATVMRKVLTAHRT
jgi:threonine aldolase